LEGFIEKLGISLYLSKNNTSSLLDPIRAQLFPNDFTVTFPTVSITMGFQSYIRPFPNSISSVFSAYSLFQHFNVRPIRGGLNYNGRSILYKPEQKRREKIGDG